MVQENMRRFDKYELEQLLGRGATSEVWKAFDPQLKRHVAIKFLHAELKTDAEVVARFKREAQGVASLHHPNIVQVYEFQLSPQNPSDIYMAMDYIEGGTLQEYIKETSRQYKFPSDVELLRLFTSIALAVDYVHQHGLIHRDIKPANIFLDLRNTTRNTMGEPMLADFGLVKIVGISTGTQPGQVLGTPLYMSPEQALGEPANISNDIYSLGVILYEMCTGVLPFQGKGQYEILVKHINDRPQLPRAFNPKISDALQDVILCCLAKEPAQRYPSASALVIALARALSLPVPPELKTNATIEEQSGQQRMLMQPDTTKQTPPFTRGQTGRIPATPLSASGSFVSVVPVKPADAPLRKIPNPETPVPPVDSMASILSLPSSLAQPQVAIHPSIKNPVPPKQPRRRLWGKTGILLLILLLLAIISSLTWAILPKFSSGTATVTSTMVGQVSFFSTKDYYHNSVDDKDEHAINDGMEGTFHLTTPASGESYYAWLRTSFGDSNGMYLTSSPSNNALTTTDGVTMLHYVDANHRNLLNPGATNGNAYHIFTIGEQKTTASPSFAAEKQRYQAVIPDQTSSTFTGTYLLHIQHLLSSDPDMDKLGLRNGLDFWFLNNVNTVYALTDEIQSHTSPTSLPMVQEWIITTLYYVDGRCAADDIKQVNPTLNTAQQPYTVHDTKVSLLDCQQNPFNIQGYIKHMGSHLDYLAQISVTTAQKQQIARLITNLSNVNKWLTNVHNDAIKLIQSYMNNLGASAAFQLRYDMANYAELALSGQLDAQTQQVNQGAALICDSIQQLANMSVTAV